MKCKLSVLMTFSDKEIVAQKENGIVTITLHRPEALNALTLEMIRLLSSGLRRWEDEDDVRAIIFRGAGDKAFCAGGDVKAAYELGMRYRKGIADERLMTLFFGEEYRLNRQLFHYKKPTFALMNGITMGGGFGIAGPCRYRLASEKTRFAMPETNIGFFTDVGSAWFLNRSPGQTGTYLGLTGNAIGPADTLQCGFATHLVPAARLDECAAAIEKTLRADASPAMLEKTLSSFTVLPDDSTAELAKNRDIIDRCFGHVSVEDIIAALEKESDPWAQAARRTLEARSPTSLKIVLSHLRRSKNEDFDTIIARDFVLAQHFMKGLDFYEGVRAALIDKDKTPRWSPARLSDVSAQYVDSYFSPTGFGLGERAA